MLTMQTILSSKTLQHMGCRSPLKDMAWIRSDSVPALYWHEGGLRYMMHALVPCAHEQRLQLRACPHGRSVQSDDRVA